MKREKKLDDIKERIIRGRRRKRKRKKEKERIECLTSLKVHFIPGKNFVTHRYWGVVTRFLFCKYECGIEKILREIGVDFTRCLFGFSASIYRIEGSYVCKE